MIELLEDFDKVIGKFVGMETSAYHEIIAMRNVVNDMLTTNTIDDETVGEVIVTFNSRCWCLVCYYL